MSIAQFFDGLKSLCGMVYDAGHAPTVNIIDDERRILRVNDILPGAGISAVERDTEILPRQYQRSRISVGVYWLHSIALHLNSNTIAHTATPF
jgi:hypothetical protein